MEKTLSYLNSKWWYRAIKVFYFFALIVFVVEAIVASYIFFVNGAMIDLNKTSIECYDGRILKLSDVGMKSIESYVPFFVYKKINIVCLTDENIGKKIHLAYPSAYKDISDEELGKSIRNKISTETDFEIPNSVVIGPDNYNLKLVYESRYWLVFVSSIISIVVILLFFETIRRVFYYIFLGKIKPQK